MQKNESRFTVYFDDPFWIGVYERISGRLLEVCKIIFGAEPKDYEVYEYLLSNWHLLQFSAPTKTDKTTPAIANPKRMRREIVKQLERKGVGTKSQQALKLQHETNKTVRKQKNREQHEAEKQAQFELRQHKKKEKHKGH